MDRKGGARVVFDIDGTREAARERCLASVRRVATDLIYDWMASLAAGYTGRKRGEVVRTRTVESFAHS